MALAGLHTLFDVIFHDKTVQNNNQFLFYIFLWPTSHLKKYFFISAISEFLSILLLLLVSSLVSLWSLNLLQKFQFLNVLWILLYYCMVNFCKCFLCPYRECVKICHFYVRQLLFLIVMFRSSVTLPISLSAFSVSYCEWYFNPWL